MKLQSNACRLKSTCITNHTCGILCLRHLNLSFSIDSCRICKQQQLAQDPTTSMSHAQHQCRLTPPMKLMLMTNAKRYIPPGEPIVSPLLTPQPRWYGELDNADPYSLLSNWVSEYAAGYGKGYQVAMNKGNGAMSNGNHAPYLGPPTNLDSMMIHNLGLDRSDQHQEVTGAQPQQEWSRDHRGHREGERETLTQQLFSLNSSAGFTRTSSDDMNPSLRSWPRRHRTLDDHCVNYLVLSNLLLDNTTASRVKSSQRSQYPLHHNRGHYCPPVISAELG